MSRSIMSALECADHVEMGVIGSIALGIMLIIDDYELSSFVAAMGIAGSDFNICPCLVDDMDDIA